MWKEASDRFEVLDLGMRGAEAGTIPPFPAKVLHLYVWSNGSLGEDFTILHENICAAMIPVVLDSLATTDHL